VSKKFLSPIKLAQGATNPATGSTGELFYNTTDLKVYIHNGTTWLPSAGGFTISDTAPTSPAPRHGDSWLDSSDGSLYARYVDQDGTGQWIQIQTNSVINTSLATRMTTAESNITTLQTNDSGKSTSIAALQSQVATDGSNITALQGRATVLEAKNMSYNYIINGAFDIWQRSTSVPHAGGGVGADMWREYTDSGSGTQAKDTTDYPVGVNQSYKFTAGANSTNWSIFQVIETSNTAPLAGKTVTFSMYLKSNAARTLRMTMSYSTSVDAIWSSTFTSAVTLDCAVTTSWARYSVTTTLPSTAKTLNIGVGAVGATLPLSSTVSVAGVQLEEGSLITPFRRNAPSIQAELSACQRYYYRATSVSGGTYQGVALGFGQSSTQEHFWMPLPTTMRAMPVLSYSAVGHWAAHKPGLVIEAATFMEVQAGVSSSNMAYINLQHASNGNFGLNIPCVLSAYNNAAAWLGFSAEL
jgi:hypothetical protein